MPSFGGWKDGGVPKANASTKDNIHKPKKEAAERVVDTEARLDANRILGKRKNKNG